MSWGEFLILFLASDSLNSKIRPIGTRSEYRTLLCSDTNIIPLGNAESLSRNAVGVLGALLTRSYVRF